MEEAPSRGVFLRAASPSPAPSPAREHTSLFALRTHAGPTDFTDALFTVCERDGVAEVHPHAGPFERALGEAGARCEGESTEPSMATLRAAEEHARARAEALATRSYGALARALTEAAHALHQKDEARWEGRRDALLRAHRAHATATLLACIELRAGPA